jgi:hypothetical protein
MRSFLPELKLYKKRYEVLPVNIKAEVYKVDYWVKESDRKTIR